MKKIKLTMAFLATLAAFLGMHQPLSAKCNADGLVWDYVIVGGGTSASQLANILTADLKTSVLMIEAGPNYDSDIRVETPAPYANQLADQYNSIYDWQQFSIGQQYAISPSGAPLTFPYVNARMLGGGSSHFGLQYARPSNYMLTQWQTISGSTLWGPTSVNNAFTSLENYNGTTNGAGDPRGTSGPVQVRQAPATPTAAALQLLSVLNGDGINSPVANSLKPAGQQLTTYNDYNDPTLPNGVSSQWQTFEAWKPTTPANERQSASIVFIEPIIDAATGKGINGRKLQVLTNSVVNKLLFKGQTAVGVDYTDSTGVSQNVYASKEVIVSAGAFSCEVLMRSGIGNYTNSSSTAYTNPYQAPWALLSASDIPMVFNNPSVGLNMKNHPLMFMAFVATPGGEPLLPATDLNAIYIDPAYFPDASNPPINTASRVISFDVAVGGGSPTPTNLNTAAILTQLLTPSSSGSVVIRSQNPNTVSIEDPNLFGDNGGGVNSNDYKILYNFFQGQGAPGTISALNGPGYNAILALINDGWTLLEPALSVYQTAGTGPGSLGQYIQNNVFHAYHYTGTCRMAPQANGGVVDAQCRVYGVNRLRVIDNSIIPTMPDCNTGSTAFVIPAIIGPMIASGSSLPFTQY